MTPPKKRKNRHPMGACFSLVEPTGISPMANIPALALNEQAPYGSVWYVNPIRACGLVT